MGYRDEADSEYIECGVVPAFCAHVRRGAFLLCFLDTSAAATYSLDTGGADRYAAADLRAANHIHMDTDAARTREQYAD